MSDQQAATDHLIAPICANCGSEIDKTERGWSHVTASDPCTSLTALSVPLPNEPDRSKAVTARPLVVAPLPSVAIDNRRLGASGE